MPCRGQYAQSKQRRLHRWLHNARINVHRLYQSLIQTALADWQDDCLYLSLYQFLKSGLQMVSSSCRVQAAAMAGVYKLEITETEADLKQ